MVDPFSSRLTSGNPGGNLPFQVAGIGGERRPGIPAQAHHLRVEHISSFKIAAAKN
jgi:hypothetical protein